MRRYLTFAIAICCSANVWAADLTGRWATENGRNTFVFRQDGETLTGIIEGEPGAPTFKIVDGKVKGDQVVFFVLHDAETDPEVQANGGNPFHNFAKGTVKGDELVITGSRENTDIRQYRIVLKRIPAK